MVRSTRLEDSASPVVLIIDDEDVVLRLVRAILEDEGFTVFEAMTGPIGLGLIPAVSPQAVVLDVMMPDMDGIEVCSRITATYPSLCVVILTARDDPALEDRCRAAGAKHFFTKPFEPQRLTDALWAACGMEPPSIRSQEADHDVPPSAGVGSPDEGCPDDRLTRDEDDELRRLHWFSEVGMLSDEKAGRVVQLRVRDRRAEIREPREIPAGESKPRSAG